MDMDLFWGNSLLDRLLSSIRSPIQDWLMSHPFWNWWLTHPLWLLVAIVFALFLLVGLLGAIARLTEKIWLAVLQAPFQLTRWIFWGVLSLLQIPFTPKASATENQQERLLTLLNRLETMRQEQEDVLREVRSILALDHPASNSAKIASTSAEEPPTSLNAISLTAASQNK